MFMWYMMGVRIHTICSWDIHKLVIITDVFNSLILISLFSEDVKTRWLERLVRKFHGFSQDTNNFGIR